MSAILDALGYVGDATEGKVCPRCKVWKPRAGFHKTKAKKDGLQAHCKDCGAASNGEWSAANPERRKRIVRNSHLKRRYGITQAAYEQMYADQEGKCGICGDEHPILCVDHDHATGKARELLCGPCNRGLGKFRDDPKALRAAAEYIERHREEA